MPQCTSALKLLVLTLFIPGTGGLRLTPVEIIAFEHFFSLVEWEIANFPRKLLHSPTNLVPGFKTSREERLELVDEYLQTVRTAHEQEWRIEGATQLRSFRAGLVLCIRLDSFSDGSGPLRQVRTDLSLIPDAAAGQRQL